MFTLRDDEALDLLVERVKYWKQSPEIIGLYEKMYKSYLDGGCFDGNTYSINEIVDNDCINWCFTVEKDESGFDDILKVYKEQGLGDCSCEDCEGNFIEAVDDEDEPTIFLMRW